MQDIKRAIDRILRIEPVLQDHLLPIREKARKNPRSSISHWNQLIGILNTPEIIKSIPESSFEGIKKIINPGIKPKEFKYSFSEPDKNEDIIGVLPDHIADRLKRCDKAMIQVGKTRYEATTTHNDDLLGYTLRKEAIIQIKVQKIWIDIRDHFKIWALQTPRLGLRSKNGVLVITSQKADRPSNPMDFLKMLGFNPTDGNPPEE